MNELSEKSFKEIANKLRNDPSQEDLEKANELRNKFNEFFNGLPQESQDDFAEIIKELK